MLEAFALLRDLKALEIASTGEETRSAEVAVDLGNRARAVMDKAVLDMGKTVVAIEQAATREVKDSAMVAGRVVPVGAGVAGLTYEDVEVLKRIALDCDQVRALAVGLRSLYEPGGDEEAALRKLHGDAQAVAGQARTIMGIRWRDYYQQWAEVSPEAANLDESFWSDRSHWDEVAPGMAPGPPKRPGTNTIQRPAPRGNPAAGPRGVNTGGPR
jgi:hypothetical protein